MLLVRRIFLVSFGIIGSLFALILLVGNCMGYGDLPASTQCEMLFPYTLKDYPLKLHMVTGYDGSYTEEDVDLEVNDVAALLVENIGDDILINTRIALYSGEDCFMFFADILPPGEKCVLLEQSYRQYINQKFFNCWASSNLAPYPSLDGSSVQVRYLDMDTLELTNLTEHTIEGIYMYHKTWSKEIGAFIWGKSYETYVDQINPGQLLLIRPRHYAGNNSKVIWITNARLSQ